MPADAIDHVVMGNALQTSGDAIYGARHVGLKAGVPVATPALTVNRLCGSGIQSVVSAAQLIQLGEARLALAGGMENMTQAPHVLRGARSGFRLGEGKLEDSLMVALLDTYCGLYMAQTSDNLARQYGITREAKDAYALLTQQRAARAAERGVFRRRSSRSTSRRDARRCASRRTITCGRTRRSKGWRSCARRSARTAS